MKKLSLLCVLMGAAVAANAAGWQSGSSQQGQQGQQQLQEKRAEWQQNRQQGREMVVEEFGAETDQFTTSGDKQLGQQIRQKINDRALTRNGYRINIMVDNGNVTLRGVVDTEREKKEIADAVNNLPGVKNVENKLHTRQGLRDQMMDKMQNHMKDKQGFRGTHSTTSPWAAATSDQMGSSRPGMSGGHASAKPNDAMLKRKIEANLKNSASAWKFEGLEIEASNGVVSVSGTLETDHDLNELTRQIRSIPQVAEVDTSEIEIESAQ